MSILRAATFFVVLMASPVLAEAGLPFNFCGEASCACGTATCGCGQVCNGQSQCASAQAGFCTSDAQCAANCGSFICSGNVCVTGTRDAGVPDAGTATTMPPQGCSVSPVLGLSALAVLVLARRRTAGP